MRKPPRSNGGSASGTAAPHDDPRLSTLDALAEEDPAVAADRILELLRAPRVDPDLLAAIARRPLWMKLERVRAAVVLHSATPRAIAMGLLSHLRWPDLARVALSPGLGAPLRTSAEKILLLRLPELALGEKVTLARTATRNVLRALLREDSPLVVRSLFDNPLLQVEDALSMVASGTMPEAGLRFIAESPRFAASEELRLALAAHPATPPAVAMRLVQSMDAALLGRLLSLPALPPLVAVAGRRRAEILGQEQPPKDA